MTTRAANIALRRFLPALIVVMAALLAVSCGGGGEGGSPSSTGEPPSVTVVTTLPVFADFVREAGGDRVQVFAVLPEGITPNPPEVSPEDIEHIRRADLILYNGLNLESTAEDVLFENARRGLQIPAYSKDVASPATEGMSAFEAWDNPYLWLDPVLAVTYVNTTWDSLVIVDEEAARTYQANGDRYNDELRALDEEIEAKLESIPSGNRKLVTFQDSFFHLARRYGLELVRLPTPVSTEEPSPRRVEEWADLIREQDVRAVFAEPNFTSDLLKQAAQRADVELCTLYSDTLDDEVTTYIEMMTFNAEELVRCLGGE